MRRPGRILPSWAARAEERGMKGVREVLGAAREIFRWENLELEEDTSREARPPSSYWKMPILTGLLKLPLWPVMPIADRGVSVMKWFWSMRRLQRSLLKR